MYSIVYVHVHLYIVIFSLCRDFPLTVSLLKRKSFATRTKMIVLFFGPKQLPRYNAIDKSLLPCLQHTNQNGVAYGCPSATIILRQPLVLKSHDYNTSHVMRKNFFYQYLFSKAEWNTNLNQVNLCLCQCSLRLRDVFNFLTLLVV